MLRKERDDAQVGSEAMISRMQDQKIRIHSLEQEVGELGCKLKSIREQSEEEVAEVRAQAKQEAAHSAKFAARRGGNGRQVAATGR